MHVACSLLLRQTRDNLCRSRTTGAVRHLQKLIFREYHHSQSIPGGQSCDHEQLLPEGEEEEAMTAVEYLAWVDEVLRGGDGYKHRASDWDRNSSDKDRDRDRGVYPVSSPTATLEDVQEYFASYMHIFQIAATTASDNILALKTQLIEDTAAHNESVEPALYSEETETEEGGESDPALLKLQGSFEEAVRRAKTAAQHDAGVAIAALSRHRREVYHNRVTQEQLIASKVAAVECVRREAMAVAHSASSCRSLGRFQVMLREELLHAQDKFEKMNQKFQQYNITTEQLVDIISQYKHRRALLSEKLTVLSNELYLSNQTADSLQNQIRQIRSNIQDNLSNCDDRVGQARSDVIQMHRLLAQQEIITADKKRLKQLLDDCASESGGLMTDQMSAEKHWAQQKACRTEAEEQLVELSSCCNFLTGKDTKVQEMLSLQVQEDTASGDSYNDVVADIQTLDVQCSTWTDASASKAVFSPNTANRLDSEQAKANMENEEARKLLLKTQKALKKLETKKRKLLIATARAQQQEAASLQHSLQLAAQVESSVAELTEQQLQLATQQEESRVSREAATQEVALIHQEAQHGLDELEQSKQQILADITSAELTVAALDISIEQSQTRLQTDTQQFSEETGEQTPATLARITHLDAEVERLKELQEAAEAEMQAARSHAVVMQQEAEEARDRALRVSKAASEEVEQLRQEQQEAEVRWALLYCV